MKYALLIRALLIFAVAIAILVPIKMIEGKISERRARADAVVDRFAAETSGSQVVVGPLLALTCEETYVAERQVMRGGKAETIAETKTGSCPTTYFAPRAVKANARIPVESLHRGIYPIRLYRATLDLAGELEWPGPPALESGRTREWKEAYIVIGVSDARGIKAISSTTSSLQSGGARVGAFPVRENLGAYASRKPGERLAFSYRMQLAGTSSLHVAPVGDASEIRMRSDWPHPSFSGAWSPDERSVTAEGFEAVWRATHVATGGQAFWNKVASEGKGWSPAIAGGVLLFDPVNVYALSYRATEYAFLFVLFTFAALGVAEALLGIRVHPMQYALAGSALAIFFLLLIALSEHMAFERAYAGAAAACVTLVTFYLRHPLGTRTRAAVFFALLVGLYGSLYVILKSEDHALLMGSLMVFGLLALVMAATRRLDWSAVSRRMKAA
jgi:inner membrane protein